MISFAAVGMIALTAPLHVFAADETATQSLAVYSIDINDANAMDTLKQQAIDSYVKANGSVKADDIDASASFISVEGLSLNHTGLQTVSISLQPAVYTNAEHTTSTLQQAWTTSAAVTVTSTGASRVVLKQDEVTVDYQSNDNIAILSTSSGSLPVIQETDNVDVNTEGTYTCTVTAIDERGQKTTVSYSVVVKKPAEVVRAEEEAARKAAEEAAAQEAAQKAAEEAAAQQAAQEAAAAAAATTTVSTNVAANPTGSSIAEAVPMSMAVHPHPALTAPVSPSMSMRHLATPCQERPMARKQPATLCPWLMPSQVILSPITDMPASTLAMARWSMP